MQSKNLILIFLFVFPILSLAIIFASLNIFSNFSPSTNFVYFEQSNAYSSATTIGVKDNKIQEIESPYYADMKRNMENCKKSVMASSIAPTDQYNPIKDCEGKFGSIPFSTDAPKPKVYLYQADKNSSKEIDLATAQSLSLVQEKQNENGESFVESNCNYGGGFFPTYSGVGPSSCSSSLTIKKNWQSKVINLETFVLVNNNQYGGYNGQQTRNVYWLKKN
jgi:hypothetical protein